MIGISNRLLILLLCVLFATEALGQRSRRGRGQLDVNLILISMGDVQEELDIRPEQGKLLEALGEDLRAQRRSNRRTNQEERANVLTKIFRVLLDEDQLNRLTQINMQFQGPYAVEDENFVKSVTLTEKQISSVREARREKRDLSYKELRDLIGEPMAKKWQKQVGKSFEFNEDLEQLRAVYLEQRRRSERRED